MVRQENTYATNHNSSQPDLRRNCTGKYFGAGLQRRVIAHLCLPGGAFVRSWRETVKDRKRGCNFGKYNAIEVPAAAISGLHE